MNKMENETGNQFEEDAKIHDERYQKLLQNFNEALDTNALIQSLTAIPHITGPSSEEKAKGLFLNREQDVLVRSLALQKTGRAIGRDAAMIKACFNVLLDEQEPTDLRHVILDFLETLEFWSPTFKAMRPDYFEVLHKLLDDSVRSLVSDATSILAIHKDEEVQQRLLQSLKDNNEPLVPTAKAIQLLSYDIHFDYHSTVREILMNQSTPEDVRVQAVYALSTDAGSKAVISNILEDKQQSKNVRLASVAAMQSTYPSDFVALGKPVVLDDSDDQEVRAASLNALMFFRDADQVFGDAEFVDKMSNISTPRSMDNLHKKMSDKFMEKANLFLNKK
jgi:HEAT repeat protein